MALPNFNFTGNGPMLDPIYLSLKTLVFENNSILDEMIYKMESNKMTFNVNTFKDGKIEPLETIIKLIKNKNKINLEVINHDKIGTVLYKLIFNNLQFVSINNLIDFDYNDQGILTLEVSYIFDDMDYINSSDKSLYRALKINKILKRDNSKFVYKLTKEELGM